MLPDEVEGLIKAGLLKESKAPNKTKEEKKVGTTKECKEGGQTKAVTVTRRSKNWYPGPGETEEPPPRPVNIGSKNIKGSNPKKVK